MLFKVQIKTLDGCTPRTLQKPPKSLTQQPIYTPPIPQWQASIHRGEEEPQLVFYLRSIAKLLASGSSCHFSKVAIKYKQVVTLVNALTY